MGFWSQIVEKFRFSEKEIDWEVVLIEADLGLKLAVKLAEELNQAGWTLSNKEAEYLLRKRLTELVQIPAAPPLAARPEVILLVGVNGSGKTTTAAKLAAQAKAEGKRVHLGAADTFRAAAAEQLEVWGGRLQVPVTRAADGTDPASVAVQSWFAASEAKADLLIIDTAGRQANKKNLLMELGKIKRSLQKKDEAIPHQTWLVADGTSGSGVISQAAEFHSAIGLGGLIVTKLDGSAKGGMIAGVREEVGLPTFFLGRGERVEDLIRFNAKAYVDDFFRA